MLLGITFASLITRIVVLLIAMTIHGFAHAYVAYLAGDPTAANQGRLTLNPFVHINWLGFGMFVLIGFGILALSTFELNSGMGLLTAITIALALVADFFFLPPLLMKFGGIQHVRATSADRI